MITHKTAAILIGVSENRLNKLCRLGLGPKRKRLKNNHWSYDKKSVANYRPVDFCRVCHKAIPLKSGMFCSPECRAAHGAIRGKKLAGRNTRPAPSTYEVRCPICKRKHVIKSKLKPDSWVYCKEHTYRRHWAYTEEMASVAL